MNLKARQLALAKNKNKELKINENSSNLYNSNIIKGKPELNKDENYKLIKRNSKITNLYFLFILFKKFYNLYKFSQVMKKILANPILTT